MLTDELFSYLVDFMVGEALPENWIGYTSDAEEFTRYRLVFVPSGFFQEGIYGTTAAMPKEPLAQLEELPVLFGKPEVCMHHDTMVVYAVTTHLHLVKRLNNAWIFNLASVLAFASVLMTFFGVNYFLSGMHSYGQNDNVSGIFVYLYAALGVIVVVAVFSYHSWKLGMRQDIDKHFINHIKENKS